MKAKKETGGRSVLEKVLTVLAVVAFAVFFYFFSEPSKPLQVYSDQVAIHILDVGQGNSAVIALPDYTILVDMVIQEESATVSAYLNDLGVEKIDKFIITHPHADHYGGAEDLLERFDVGEVLMTPPNSDLPVETASFVRLLDKVEASGVLRYVTEEETHIVGDTEITIYPPPEGADIVNDLSLYITVTLGECELLMTADAEKNSERAFSEYDIGEMDIVYGFHHGSYNSATLELLSEIKPKMTVISLEVHNRYGFPHDEFLQRVNIYGDILRTDLDGDIVIVPNGETTTVYTEKTERTFTIPS